MTDPEVIRMLWNLGHFRNPDFPESHNVTEDDVDSLKLGDETVKAAVQSYQEFFKDTLDDLALTYHHRTATPDGDLGPATHDLLEMPRCGTPDFSMEEGALPAGGFSACDNAITFAAVANLFRGLTQEECLHVFDEMARNWSGALAGGFRITVISDINSAIIFATKESLPGSTLAWSQLRNACRYRAKQAYDTTISWKDANLELPVTTCGHEVGHAIGLEHNRDSTSLLYPSINAAAKKRRGFPNQTDLRQCQELGYTVAADPKPLPPGGPPPTPDDGTLVGSGILTVGGVLYQTTFTGRKLG